MLENACMKEEALPPKLDRTLNYHKPSFTSVWIPSSNLGLNQCRLEHEESAQSQGDRTPGLRSYYLGSKLSKLFRGLAHWCRPTPRRNHSRLEWHCCCGQQFWGDYKSDEPEKLHQLVSDLQQHGFAVDTTMMTMTASGTSSTAGTTTSPQNTATSASTSSPNSSLSTTAVKHGASATPSGTTSPAVRKMTVSAPVCLQSIGKPVYLELCINRSSRVTQLGEIIIVDGRGQQLIHTDLELFGKFFYLLSVQTSKCAPIWKSQVSDRPIRANCVATTLICAPI
jgi:hypothetical protein